MVKLEEYSPSDILVLCPAKDIAYELKEKLSSVEVQSHCFYQEDSLSDSKAQAGLTLLSLLVNREDWVSFRFWLGLGHKKFRATEYKRLFDFCLESGDSPSVALQKHISGLVNLGRVSGIAAQFEELTKTLSDLKDLILLEVVDALFPDEESTALLRKTALDFIEQNDDSDTSDLLNRMKTTFSQPEKPEEGDYVRIMSLHKSKGLSSKVVIIASCVEGFIPRGKGDIDRKSLEEQRRLFYVGLTRAREDLLISSFSKTTKRRANLYQLKTRSARGNFAPTHASRFIGELNVGNNETGSGNDFLNNFEE